MRYTFCLKTEIKPVNFTIEQLECGEFSSELAQRTSWYN